MKLAIHTSTINGEAIVDQWQFVLDDYTAPTGWTIIDHILYPAPVTFFLNHDQYKYVGGATPLVLKVGGFTAGNRVLASASIDNSVAKALERANATSYFGTL